MLPNVNIFTKSLLGQHCEAMLAPLAHFLYLNERGDQGLGLSNGGCRDLVRCLERWQIAFEKNLFRKKTLIFENILSINGLKALVIVKDFVSNQHKTTFVNIYHSLKRKYEENNFRS